jgi:hypothetical protein
LIACAPLLRVRSLIHGREEIHHTSTPVSQIDSRVKSVSNAHLSTGATFGPKVLVLLGDPKQLYFSPFVSEKLTCSSILSLPIDGKVSDDLM